jgi:MFS family permease
VSLAFAPDIATVVVSQAIIGVGAGLFFSVALALATEVLPDTGEAAKDLGVLNAAASLPQSVAPAIAPAIIAFGAATSLGGFTAYYLFGAILALAAAGSIYRVKGVK